MSERKVSTTEEVVEHMAEAIYASKDGSQAWESLDDTVKDPYRARVRRHMNAGK